jgi:hypothetical protein
MKILPKCQIRRPGPMAADFGEADAGYGLSQAKRQPIQRHPPFSTHASGALIKPIKPDRLN